MSLLERFGFRYCPHCATALIEREMHGRVRRVCPAAECGYIQFIEPKVSVSTLVAHEGKILLTLRNMEPGLGKWCFPGGFMEAGETPQQAAARECLEETGLDIEVGPLIEVSYYESYRGSGVLITYEAALIGGTAQAGDDAAAVQFFNPHHLPPLAFESNRAVIERWQAGDW